MVRTGLAFLWLFSFASAAVAQAQPREQLRYDGKPFAFWESFQRNELKAEKRIDALRAMAAFGSRGYAKEATAAIVELLKDYDNDADAFKIDSETPQKGTPDQRVIHEALWALTKIGPDASPIVLANLDRAGVRRAAYLYFDDPNAIALSSVSILVKGIALGKPEARDASIDILGAAIYVEDGAKKEHDRRNAFHKAVTSKNRAKIVHALANALERDRNVPAYAAFLLGILGPTANAAIPALVLAELNGNTWADEALKQIKATPAGRIPVLVAELRKGESSRQQAAAKKLGELGADAHAALPDLLIAIKKPMRKLDHSEPRKAIVEPRMEMLNALVKIAGPKDALRTITELIDTNQFPLIESELVDLYLMHEKNPSEIVPLMTKTLDRNLSEEKLRYQTFIFQYPPFPLNLFVVLGAQRENAGSAVPVLLKALEKSDTPTKGLVIDALAKIGPPAKDALPMLGKLLQAEDADLRRAAAEAISAITKN